jgi:hypothetical protein
MREEGYYFVKIEGKWDIARYYKYKFIINVSNSQGFWNSLEWDEFRSDRDFDEIGDKIELPKD